MGGEDWIYILFLTFFIGESESPVQPSLGSQSRKFSTIMPLKLQEIALSSLSGDVDFSKGLFGFRNSYCNQKYLNWYIFYGTTTEEQMSQFPLD